MSDNNEIGQFCMSSLGDCQLEAIEPEKAIRIVGTREKLVGQRTPTAQESPSVVGDRGYRCNISFKLHCRHRAAPLKYGALQIDTGMLPPQHHSVLPQRYWYAY